MNMASQKPTYGELIQLLGDAEKSAKNTGQCVSELLCFHFQKLYPHIPIGRPGRFYDTVQRVAAPTRPSSRNPLCGSPLRSYLKRSWSPRIRNTKQGCVPVLSVELKRCGLKEDILMTALSLCSEAHELPVDVRWSLNEIPTVGFYRELHNFLRKLAASHGVTKIAVGRLYVSIDPELRRKRMCSRPDNVYQFIERIALSDKPNSAIMQYGERELKCLQKEVESYSSEVQDLSLKVMEQQKELTAMKREVEVARKEVSNTKHEVKVLTRKLEVAQRKQDIACTKVQRYQEELETTVAESVLFEEELLQKNEELTGLVSDLKDELSSFSCLSVSLVGTSTKQVHTKDGKVYSPAIRKLYYSLLANQIPPSKIEATIKAILRCFFPMLNLEQLQLPSESCASYMRRHELTTLSSAHKATSLLKQAETGFLHLNTDGTTKFQKKIEGAAINGMVLSVNHVLDGSATSMIEDVSQELKKLRETAHALKLPNSDKINWTLIASSTSDSASTQKRFNKLVEEKRAEDEERFGKVSPEAFELVENFCAMHLGVNLRKAFLDGVRHVTVCNDSSGRTREHQSVDTFVHEFCKLLGKHGVPEYGLGIVAFADFLCQPNEKEQYYSVCAKVHLDRQIGSRYFVTASNAGKILFLREAAIDFLMYSGKCNGNKLEQDIFQKLHNPDLLSQLKADALMFHHVYSNLVMLAKSTDLNKSAFDMRQHYLKLRLFLQEIELNPQTATNIGFEVFTSEKRLYGTNTKYNHRLRHMYRHIEQQIFKEEESDTTLLYPLLATGASAMKEKLCAYAQSLLPGGRYWEPDPKIRAILCQLKPNNDLCEGILGLNDYLTTAIPNLHQLSRSNIIEVKKNKTISWFEQLSKEQQEAVIQLAVQRRREVAKRYKHEEAIRTVQRREKMAKEKRRRDVLEMRAREKRERLACLHLITSTAELQEVLAEIASQSLNTKRKFEKQRALIKEQVRIRKSVLEQNINIPFTHKGRQRPVKELISELSHYLAANTTEISTECTPESLVGKEIIHKFNVNGEEKWFNGYVISYNAVTHLHEVSYDEEEQTCFFNLLEDLSSGDLIIDN